MVAYFNLNNLKQQTGFAINGTVSNGMFGVPLANAGDVNCDGIPDLLIGAYYNDMGSVYVLYGNSAGYPLSFNTTYFDGINGMVLQGMYWPSFDPYHDGYTNHGSFGSYLSSAGDFNGDNCTDILAGAPFSSPNGIRWAGSSFLIYGATNLPATLNVTYLDGNNGFRMDGAAQWNQAGIVATAKDFDKDGQSEILIGSRYSSDNGPNSGQVTLIYGSKNSFPAVVSLAEVRGINFDGDPLSQLGAVPRSAGDVDGDGYDDFVAGAPSANGIYENYASFPYKMGNVYLLYGTNEVVPSPVYVDQLNGKNGTKIIGAQTLDAIGYCIAGIGDINHDGYADIGVSAVRYSLPNQQGQVYVIYGNSERFPAVISLSDIAQYGFSFTGLYNEDHLGAMIVGLGDVNGDKIDDFMFADEPFSTSGVIHHAYVVFGSPEKQQGNISVSALNGKNGFVINAPALHTFFADFGCGVDLNNDGLNDIVLFASGPSGLGEDKGQVFVIYGSSDFSSQFTHTEEGIVGVVPDQMD